MTNALVAMRVVSYRTTPISRSALEMNPMLGHLFEGNPVGEGIQLNFVFWRKAPKPSNQPEI